MIDILQQLKMFGLSLNPVFLLVIKVMVCCYFNIDCLINIPLKQRSINFVDVIQNISNINISPINETLPLRRIEGFKKQLIIVNG
ncbi:hypothetical protein CGJ21_11660 [Vibrio parahaemolyticus]|nr:hypothetical protein CGJ23_09975 [Vibrio parahaemolyticus]TOF48542.1 hypothetical protein CGJ21_11660 [Vibrio parahaemolyticus]